jgi:predicted GNAT family acetyltransferase
MTTASATPAGITLTTDIRDLDWQSLKVALTADDFDNGRTPEQLRKSSENSFLNCFAYSGPRIVGTARVLSDGVCNAYIIDVWTQSGFRRRGVAAAMIRSLLPHLDGQHVYLFSGVPEFWEAIGFQRQGSGLEMVVGEWLKSATDR